MATTRATPPRNRLQPRDDGPPRLELAFLSSRRGTDTSGAPRLNRRGTERSEDSPSAPADTPAEPTSTTQHESQAAASSSAPRSAPAAAMAVATASIASDLPSFVANDFRKLWKAVASTRLMALLSFLLTLVLGIAAWIASDSSNRWSKGSYDIAFYQLCDTDVHRHDPGCTETLSRGVTALAIHKRDLELPPNFGPTTQFHAMFWSQKLSIRFEDELASAESLGARYARALAFRNTILAGVLQSLDGLLRVEYPNSTLNVEEAALLIHSLWRIQNLSTLLHDGISTKIRPLNLNLSYAKHLVPFSHLTMSEIKPQILHTQYLTLELFRKYLLSAVYDPKFPEGTTCRAWDECWQPQYAIRRFLVAEELLIRVGEDTRIRPTYDDSGWWLSRALHDIDRLQSNVAEQRVPVISPFRLGRAYALRILRIWLAFELGAVPVAHFALADVYATFFSSQPKAYLAVLLLIAVILYATPRLRGRLPGIQGLWPILWYWYFSYLSYQRTSTLHSKGLYPRAAHTRWSDMPHQSIFTYCGFWFQATALADVTTKMVLFLTVLDALQKDSVGPNVDIIARIGDLVWPNTPHRRFRIAEYILYGLLCIYGILLHLEIWRLLQPLSPELLSRSSFQLTPSNFLDYQTCLVVLSPFLALHIAFRLHKPRVAGLYIISAFLKTQDSPISGDFVRCNKRYHTPYELPADLGVEIPLLYHILLMVARHHILRAYRRGMTRWKSL